MVNSLCVLCFLWKYRLTVEICDGINPINFLDIMENSSGFLVSICHLSNCMQKCLFRVDPVTFLALSNNTELKMFEQAVSLSVFVAK